MPGHDSKLRVKIERTVGGVIPLSRFVEAARGYVTGEIPLDEFSEATRAIFKVSGDTALFLKPVLPDTLSTKGEEVRKEVSEMTRKAGLKYLERRLHRRPPGHIAVSKLYAANESPTETPVWWFDLPLKILEQSISHEVHLLGHVAADDFHYLKVPISFFRDQLHALSIVKGTQIYLHLSAEEGSIFRDLRGSGQIPFSGWFQGA